MSEIVMVDASIAVGPLELRCTSSKVTLSPGIEVEDTTTFCSGGWRTKAAALGDWSAMVQGYYNPDGAATGAVEFDKGEFDALGTVVPVSIAPSSADGSVAYLGAALAAKLDQFDQVGKVAPFSLELPGSGRLARGVLLHPPATARTASGTGTGRQLTTVPADRELVAVCNVVAALGTTPSLTVTLQRDDNAGFSSATTVGTFGPFTAPGSGILRVAGPITPDDRYRITWTISGTGPSFLFSAAVGLT